MTKINTMPEKAEEYEKKEKGSPRRDLSKFFEPRIY